MKINKKQIKIAAEKWLKENTEIEILSTGFPIIKKRPDELDAFAAGVDYALKLMDENNWNGFHSSKETK